MNLFLRSADLLENKLDIDKAAGEDEDQARQFLAALGYLSEDPTTIENRQALLRLAGRFDSIFPLRLRHAPGAFGFGARTRLEEFGIDGIEGSTLDVAGRGTDMRQAFESCVGEGAEHLSLHEWPQDHLLMTHAKNDFSMITHDATMTWMAAAMGLPGSEILEDLPWMAVEHLTDAGSDFLPVDMILRRASCFPATALPAGSNGCCAAPTIELATAGALLELIERDAYASWWFGERRVQRLPQALIVELGIQRWLATLRVETSRQVWFIDISTEIGVPVIACLSSEPDGAQVIAGFAASPDPHTAMRRAALEMCQMEAACELALQDARGRLLESLSPLQQNWVQRAAKLNLSNFPRLLPPESNALSCAANSSSDVLGRTLEGLAHAGFQAYRANLTRPEIGIPVVRAIVPGLQSAKPDWPTPRLLRLRGGGQLPAELLLPEHSLI